ncbi:MAG: hypothetical protein ACXWAT_13275 [Methylobacter sp.]
MQGRKMLLHSLHQCNLAIAESIAKSIIMWRDGFRYRSTHPTVNRIAYGQASFDILTINFTSPLIENAHR